MPVKKEKNQKISVGQPHVAEDARKAKSKKTGVTRSLSERRPRKTGGSVISNKKSAFSSSASGLPSKAKNLKVDVYDTKGKVVETIALPKEIFGAKINDQLIAQAVRVYLANQRKGTASTKTRGEVEGSTRKIYKQKGTGRARHGSIRAPIFVKGGIVFGPKPRDYSLKFSKKMKRAALFSVLSAKLNNGGIKIVKGVEKIEPKTKIIAGIVKNLELANKKVLFVLPTDEKLENVVRAARNLKNLTLSRSNELNALIALNNNFMLLTKDSLDSISKTFLKEK